MDLKATLQEIVKVVRAASTAQKVDGGTIPFVIVPNDHTVKYLPELIYNDHAKTPERIKQNVKMFDVKSFCEYYTLFSDENSRVFADEVGLSIQAILDYHGALEGMPRWGQHTATLTLRESPEWKAWSGFNNRQFTQQAFAEFLEQYATDIVSPDPAAIIEVSRDLQGTTEVEFGSGQRMTDGQIRFRYSETTKTTTGAGSMLVPEQFTIAVSPFIGLPKQNLHALLRHRVKEGAITFWYTLVRPEEVIRQCFTECREQIAGDLGIRVLNGSPK